MSFEYEFSHDIYNARIKQGWKQRHVADEISISVREYQNIEAGKAIQNVKNFLRLVYVFNIDIQKYRKELC